jgi:hypothetical protein
METHEYTAEVEHWVTQADLGLVVSYRNDFDEDEYWDASWLLQAKRLLPDDQGQRYTGKARFGSRTHGQDTRMEALRSLVGPFLCYLLYCPRPASLDLATKSQLARGRRNRLSDEQLDWDWDGTWPGISWEIRNDLLLAEPTTAAGMFVVPLSDAPATLADVHGQIAPVWGEGTCPFAWFVIGHLFRSKALTVALSAEERDIAREIVRGNPAMVDLVRATLSPELPDRPFPFLPAHTISIEIRTGPTRDTRHDERYRYGR